MPSTQGSSIHRLRLRTSRDGEAVVIHCTGRLISDYTEELRQEFLRVLPGTRRIVLDLSDLRHMDSSGLGTLVRLYLAARSASCELQLVNLNDRIKDLLGLTNLWSVFGSCGQYLTKIP